jgi:AraC-like DNA-binding protein
MAAHLTSHEFWSLMNANGSSRQAYSVGDLQVEFDTGVMKLSSHIVIAPGVTIVRGRNVARDDIVLSGEQEEPLVALQIGLRGTASTRIEGLEEPFRNYGGHATLVFTPPGPFEVALEEGTTNEVLRLNFTLDYFAQLTERYPALGRGPSKGAAPRPMLMGGGRSMGPLRRLVDLADDVMESEAYGSLRAAFLESKVVELLTRYLAVPPDPSDGPMKPRDVDRMIEARDRLLSRLADPPTLPELARSVGTNEFRLKRDFKALFGQPVHAFVLERRLERARELLVQTDRPIKEIADQAGFAHVSHFGSAFRKRYGVPPSRIRARRS